MDKVEILRQMITEKRKQIELYQAMIEEWERELGTPHSVTAAHRVPVASDTRVNSGGAKVEGADALSVVKDYEFHNKSQTEAARIVLERVGYPLTTQQIIDAISRGGITVGGKTPQAQKTNFYTILHRSKENFGLAAKDRWGLRGWKGIPKLEGKDEEEDATKEEESTDQK